MLIIYQVLNEFIFSFYTFCYCIKLLGEKGWKKEKKEKMAERKIKKIPFSEMQSFIKGMEPAVLFWETYTMFDIGIFIHDTSIINM